MAQFPVGRWLYDNPHTQYTLYIDIEKRRRRCVYDWRGFKIYDWRRRLSHMQMTDSDFTQNDWRRRLGGGGAGHYRLNEMWAEYDPGIHSVRLLRACSRLYMQQ